jgi:hypothetical protein
VVHHKPPCKITIPLTFNQPISTTGNQAQNCGQSLGIIVHTSIKPESSEGALQLTWVRVDPTVIQPGEIVRQDKLHVIFCFLPLVYGRLLIFSKSSATISPTPVLGTPFSTLFTCSLITGFTNLLYSLILAAAPIALLFLLLKCLPYWSGFFLAGLMVVTGFLWWWDISRSSFWLYNLVLRRPFCT